MIFDLLLQEQSFVLIHLYGKSVEKSFSQNVLKIIGWNLQCMIEIVKLFSYDQNFVPQGLSSLDPGLLHV